MKMIRIDVELFNPNDTTEYEDLPDNWDEMSEGDRDTYLTTCAVEALANQASSAASVVEVDDDDGNEVSA